VDHDSAVINQRPAIPGVVLHTEWKNPVLPFELPRDFINNSVGLPLARPTANDKEIGDNRPFTNIQQDNVLPQFVGDQIDNLPRQVNDLDCAFSSNQPVFSDGGIR